MNTLALTPSDYVSTLVSGLTNPTNTGSASPYCKEALEEYKPWLNADVYLKYLFFFDTPADVTCYNTRGMTYETAALKPSQVSPSTHNLYFSSKEIPYAAKVYQPCYGQLGGWAPNTTELYIWVMNSYHQQHPNIWEKHDPFAPFFNDVQSGMFIPTTPLDIKKKFHVTYGVMYTPKVLESWPSPIVSGFAIHMRDGAGLDGMTRMDRVLKGLIGKHPKANAQGKEFYLSYGFCMGDVDICATWDTIKNFVNGRFNSHIMKLPSYAVDPDYSSWDGPLKNLFTNYDITAKGKNYPGRATDMIWDNWVIKGNAGGWYGLDSTDHSKDGEVVEALDTLFKTTGTTSYETAKKLAELYILEKTNESKSKAA